MTVRDLVSVCPLEGIDFYLPGKNGKLRPFPMIVDYINLEALYSRNVVSILPGRGSIKAVIS